MRTLARALFLSAAATAVFGGLLYALAPEALRSPGPMPEPARFDEGKVVVYDDDEGELTEAEATALLRELATQFG